MRMRGWLVIAAFLGTTAAAAPARAAHYVEYYRDNLFLGLAYHRVGCMTDWSTIQSNQDYDGFTGNRYCVAGASADGVPSGQWFDYDLVADGFAATQSTLNACGAQTNNRYGTPVYAARSNTCSYNILTNCNSDCWIRYFSTCVGHRVATVSPCGFSFSYP